MARAAHRKLDSKTARLKFKPRANAYFTSLQPKLLLGYVRRPGTEAGRWVVQRQLGRNENNDPVRSVRTLAMADDYAIADGENVLTFEQARAKALSPDRQAASGPLTVAQAIDLYLADLSTRKGERAAKDARGKLHTHVIPTLGEKPVATLTLSDLRTWLNSLARQGDDETVRRSKDTANRTMASFKAALNYVFADDAYNIPSDKAWRALKSFKAVGAAREDHFTEAEALSLIEASRKLGDEDFANLLEAAFHTGARPPGELARLDVRDFHAQRAQITIPGGKTGKRTTTLSAEGVEFFKRLAMGKTPADILVARADGTRWDRGQQHRRMKAALAAAGLPLTAGVYAMRHSYISLALQRGMPIDQVARNVGTSIKMIEQNYGKYAPQALRDSIERHAPKLRLVVGASRDAA